MADRLKGKIALITGAARGIGAAIASDFIQEGAVVWLTDVRVDEGEELAASLGANARFFRLDVSAEADWSAGLSAVLARDGRLDVLVNNAGITGFESSAAAQDPCHASLEDWHHVHRVTLDGVFLGCREALRTMSTTGDGSIINIGSRSGVVGIPGAAAYASAKAAVRNHTRSVALWAAQQGFRIRCNVIQPAAILTSIWEPMLGDGPDRQARMASFVADTPLKRFGTPGEVAAVAVLLASDEATYITGTEINVDGGLLAGAAATPARAQE